MRARRRRRRRATSTDGQPLPCVCVGGACTCVTRPPAFLCVGTAFIPSVMCTGPTNTGSCLAHSPLRTLPLPLSTAADVFYCVEGREVSLRVVCMCARVVLSGRQHAGGCTIPPSVHRRHAAAPIRKCDDDSTDRERPGKASTPPPALPPLHSRVCTDEGGREEAGEGVSVWAEAAGGGGEGTLYSPVSLSLDSWCACMPARARMGHPLTDTHHPLCPALQLFDACVVTIPHCAVEAPTQEKINPSPAPPSSLPR